MNKIIKYNTIDNNNNTINNTTTNNNPSYLNP